MTELSVAPEGGALVDTARDLACPALWQASLERSLARRGRPTRSSLELFQLRAERDLSRPELLRESLMYSQLRRSAAARRPSMAVPGAGGISALALLAATTLPGLLGARAGAHPAAAHGTDTGKAPLAKTPAAGPPAGSKLAAKPTEASTAELPATAAPARPAEPSHVVAARTLDHPRAVASHPSTTTTTKHILLAHDAAAPNGVTSAAHALSGGVAAAAPKLPAAAPRVPVEPQPTGHPSTGGGTLEAASRTQTPTRIPHAPATFHAPTHSGGAATIRPAAISHPIKASHPVEVSHPVTAKPLTTTHPKPVTTTHPRPVATTHPKPVTATHPVSTAKPAPKPTPAPAPPATDHYVNPLAGASVTPERIDQGVDYSGSGTLGAIGDGKVTYVGTTGTGWPGAFIEFRLTDGADAGRYVFYAESISPAPGLHVGQTVRAGQPIASINGGIEIGWGSGVGSQPAAQADGQWSGGDDASNHATPDGKSFSALIAQLGGPPGKVEG